MTHLKASALIVDILILSDHTGFQLSIPQLTEGEDVSGELTDNGDIWIRVNYPDQCNTAAEQIIIRTLELGGVAEVIASRNRLLVIYQQGDPDHQLLTFVLHILQEEMRREVFFEPALTSSFSRN